MTSARGERATMLRKTTLLSLFSILVLGAITFAQPASAQSQPAVYSCDGLTVTANGTSITAQLAYTAKYGAGMQMTTYDFGDGKVIGTHETSVQHVYAAPGTYTIQAKMRIIVDNKRTINDVTSPACQKTISVGETAQVATPTQSSRSQGASEAIDARQKTTSSAVSSASVPANVTELPKTGTGDTIVGAFGLALIVFLSIVYIRQEQKKV